MNNPKRYKVDGDARINRFRVQYFVGKGFTGIMEDEAGNLVQWSDYAKLKLENERLRKAGDEVCRIAIPSYAREVKEKAIAAWNAAKEVQK